MTTTPPACSSSSCPAARTSSSTTSRGGGSSRGSRWVIAWQPSWVRHARGAAVTQLERRARLCSRRTVLGIDIFNRDTSAEICGRLCLGPLGIDRSIASIHRCLVASPESVAAATGFLTAQREGRTYTGAARRHPARSTRAWGNAHVAKDEKGMNSQT
jgi:hypothetical protein